MRIPSLKALRESVERDHSIGRVSAAAVSTAAGKRREWAYKVEAKAPENLGLIEFIEYVEALGLRPGDLLDNSAGVTAELRPLVKVLSELSTMGRESAAVLLNELAKLDAQRIPPRPLGPVRLAPARTAEATSVLEEIAIHDRGRGK